MRGLAWRPDRFAAGEIWTSVLQIGGCVGPIFDLFAVEKKYASLRLTQRLIKSIAAPDMSDAARQLIVSTFMPRIICLRTRNKDTLLVFGR